MNLKTIMRFSDSLLYIGGNETEQKFTESKSYMEWIKGLYEKAMALL